MLAEDLFQKLGVAVEGKAKVFHLARFLELMNKIKGVKFFRLGIGARLHAMQPVVIDVLHAQAFELTGEKVRHLLRLFEHEHRQLVGDRVGIPWIALDHRFAEGHLALPLVVAGRRVEIGESSREKLIGHLLHRLDVHTARVICIQERQTHQAKTKFFYDPSTPF